MGYLVRVNTYIYGRFSSDRQEEGDSKRRQIDNGQAFAQRLELPAPKVFFDEGVSAKAGKNLEKEFARMVGELKKGDVIIVEDLDRISRMHPWLAKAKVYEIINNGITICTWRDSKKYTSDNINELDTFLVADVISGVAFIESAKKKTRQLARWDGWIKEIEAGKKIVAFRTPPWIDYDEKQESFSLNSKAGTVKQIFHLADSGKGSILITKQLMKEGVPPLQGNINSRWNDTYVRYILRNTTTIGTLNLSTRNRDFPNYYPAAVDEKLFYRVQAKIPKISIGGAPAIKEVNVFKSILFCSCGSKIYGCGNNRAKDYYCCHNARLGNGCKFHFVPKDKLRRAVIDSLKENASFLVNISGESYKTESQSVLGELDVVSKQIEKITRFIVVDDNPPISLVNTLKELEVKQATLKTTLNAVKANQTIGFDDILKDFIKSLETEDYMELQRTISDVVKRIVVNTTLKTGEIYFIPNRITKRLGFVTVPGCVVIMDPSIRFSF